MPCSFFRDSVVVIRPLETTRNGKPVQDWANATRTTVGRCHVQPSTTDRDHDGRQVSVSDEMTVYAPIAADIKAGDRIEWNGEQYSIEGLPQMWRSPSGRVSNQQVRIKRWSG